MGMDMEDKINVFIGNYFTDDDGDIKLYRIIDDEDNESSIEDSIIQLFKENGFSETEYSVELNHIYDSVGLDIYIYYISLGFKIHKFIQ